MFRLIICAIADWFKASKCDSSHDAFVLSAKDTGMPSHLFGLFIVCHRALELSIMDDLHGYLSWKTKEDFYKYLPGVDLNKYTYSDIPEGWLEKY